jgi:hypothetical protein
LVDGKPHGRGVLIVQGGRYEGEFGGKAKRGRHVDERPKKVPRAPSDWQIARGEADSRRSKLKTADRCADLVPFLVFY